MKSMQKQAQQPSRGKEEKGPLVQIKLGGTVEKGGLKKRGFKRAFGAVEDEQLVDQRNDVDVSTGEMKGKVVQHSDSDLTDEEDYYDPRQPTGCMPGCHSKARAAVA